ncbi:MAG: FtsX-like permease family protein [Thermoproteota archaeon]
MLSTTFEMGWCQPQAISGRVVDASSGKPVSGASVIVWDTTDPTFRLVLGFNLYKTDEQGYYQVDPSYLKAGHEYRIYAFKGKPPNGPFEYVPSRPVMFKFEGAGANISFRLVQGACLLLEGELPYIRAEGDARKIVITVLDYQTGKELRLYDADFLDAYGTSLDTVLLNISERLVIIPANIRVILKIDAFFTSNYTGNFRLVRFNFVMDNITYGYVMNAGGFVNASLWEYAFTRNYDIINGIYMDMLQKLENASKAGFIVFNEKDQLDEVNQLLFESRQLSINDPRKSLYRMKVAYNELQVIDKMIGFMYINSAINALRLPAFLAVFAVALGFFMQEKERRKIVSSLIFYAILLAVTYLTYPGVATFTNEDMRNLVLSSFISIIAAFSIIFGIPKIWREPQVEGQVSLRAVTATIFSMSKREIRRRGIRSFLPILSLCLLVMAFTALTSFGTVYDLRQETRFVSTAASGALVRRGNDMLNFIPISTSDLEILSDIPEVIDVSPKIENFRDLQSLGEVLFKENGYSATFSGTIGIDPQEEQKYVDLKGILMRGDLPSDDQVVMSRSMAEGLRVELGDRILIYVRGIGQSVKEMTVVGIFDENRIASLTDINGRPYLPLKLFQSGEEVLSLPCNASDVLIMNWKGLLDLQLRIRSLQPEGGPLLAAISRIAFSMRKEPDPQSLIRRLTFALGFTVDVATPGEIDTYSLGYYYDARGGTEMIILMVMVVLNVGAIMLNAVYERHNEMKTLTLLGLNPAHIGFMFVAEAIVTGILGGGIGYVMGLGFQRAIALLGQNLTVRSKIEWWWSVIGLLLSLGVSVLASFRAASLAIKTYTPSMVKRIKVSMKEKERRKAEVYRIFQAREVSMPVRLQPVEVDFFTSYVHSYLSGFRSGIIEKVENVEEAPLLDLEDGSQKKEIKFTYFNLSRGKAIGTRNKILLIRDAGRERFRVSFSYEPIEPGIHEEITDRAVEMMKDICYSWVKEKDKYVVGFR